MRYAASLAAFGLDSALSTMAGRWTNSLPSCWFVVVVLESRGWLTVRWMEMVGSLHARGRDRIRKMHSARSVESLSVYEIRSDGVRTTSLIIFPSGESSGKAEAGGVPLNVEPGRCGEFV